MQISDRTKIILGIIGLILAIVVIGVAIYFSFFRTSAPTPSENGANGGAINGSLPNANAPATINGGTAVGNVNGALPAISTIAQGGNTRTETVVDTITDAMTTGANGREVLYYDPADGKFYKIGGDGQTKSVLIDRRFPNVSAVTWSPKKDKAIIGFPDDTKLLLDFARNTQTTLPKELSDFSFSPASDKIAAKFSGPQPEDRWLVVANPDGSQAQIIESLGAQADRVTANWSPNNQVVATFEKSTGADTEDIIFIGRQNENFSSLAVEGRGFTGQWSPDGTRMAYSVHNAGSSYTPELYIVDAAGDAIGNRKTKLDLRTWADKCSFSRSGSAIYCAEPESLPPGSGLRPEIARGTPDRMYRVDLRTGAKTLLAIPVDGSGRNQFSARNLFVTDDEATLFFSDWTTGRVHSIRLR